MQESFYLSNFGTHYFLKEYVDAKTVAAGANVADELQGIFNCTLGEISKEVAKKRTLNGNGWEVVTSLGQSLGDGNFECVRLGTGNAYVGVAGDDTYTKIRDWFREATANAGVNSPKQIIEVVDRGGEFEGTVYNVVPSNWGPGAKDTESGQEYSFTVTPFGAPIPVKVTHVAGTGETAESWTFEKASA